MKVSKLLPFLLVLLLLTACSKTVMEKNTADDQQPQPVARIQPAIQEPAPADEPQAASADPEALEIVIKENIYFDFDSAVLKPEARSLLQIKAQWLKDNPDVIAVLVEGHCDERGTDAYNLALGSRRADAVKKFMADMGLSNLSIQTRSYGEEKPMDPGHNEKAWAKNRRASFVIN